MRARPHQIGEDQNQIIEVESVVSRQRFLILLENLGDFAFAISTGFAGVQSVCIPVVFQRRNRAAHFFRRKHLLVEIEFLQFGFQDGQTVSFIVDDEVLRPGPAFGSFVVLYILSEHARAHAVECSNPRKSRISADCLFNTCLHLFGGFVGESHRHNRIGILVQFLDQPRDSARENSGFAGACAGDDKRWTPTLAHGLSLLVVQPSKKFVRFAALRRHRYVENLHTTYFVHHDPSLNHVDWVLELIARKTP